jgi:hypothetical protein
MPRPKVRVALRVETMESRELLSGAVPVLTMNTYNAVVADVENVMGTLAKTHNFAAAGSSLAIVSTNIPFGRQQLFPAWQADLGIYSSQVVGSGLAMQAAILNDLNAYILAGVAGGAFQVTGSGSSVFNPRPPVAAAPSRASVTIINQTPYQITVTATLAGNPVPITRMIVKGASSLIDFNSNSNNVISINIQRTDGLSPPPPLTGYLLPRPVNGYDGKAFPITVFAMRFSVVIT